LADEINFIKPLLEQMLFGIPVELPQKECSGLNQNQDSGACIAINGKF
jgi:hypothetical protein